MPYEPLHHKYRPQTFADLVGQETIALTLSNALKQEKIAPAYLFTGPRGTGKTSSARILAKSLNCMASSIPTPEPCGKCEACLAIAKSSALDVMEIDAASNTGVDNIREIIERSRFAPVQCRYKIYAIDECHMLSTAAFNALLKTLEEPPPNVVFILATTDPQRVLSTIISRCQRFDYRRIPLAQMTQHLKYIADRENIAIADEALTLIAQIANGGLRDAESLLDQLSLLPDEISVVRVWDLVGAVPEQDLIKLLQAISSQDSLGILQQCRSLLDRGREPLVVLQNLASFYLNLLIAKTAPQRPDLVAVTETCWQQLCQEAKNWDTSLILLGQRQLQEAETQLKHTTQPRLWLEVTLLGLLSNNNSISATNIISAPNHVANQSLTVAHKAKAVTSSENSASKANSPAASQVISQAPPPPDHNISSKKLVAEKTSQPEKPLPQPIEAKYQPKIQQDNLPPSISHHAPSSEDKTSEPVIASTNHHVATKNVVTENIDTKEMWSKVVSCLHPPTTQALLKQQCHLVSFDGSSAIVGISSARLQKLNQGKVSNIEAAFAQVCQRKIKVQLEVVSLKPASVKNSLSSIDNSPPQVAKSAPDRSTAIQSSEVSPNPSPSTASYSQTIPQTLSPHSQEETKPRSNSALETPPPFTSNSQSSVGKVAAVSSPGITQSENKVAMSSESIVSQDLNRDYTDDNLQQAIDNLTQSFEGELVQLDNNQEEFDATSEPEIDNLTQSFEGELVQLDNNQEEFYSTSEPEEEALNPNRGRPNLEDYDDDW